MDGTGAQFSTDSLGNLIGLAPGSPFITNAGDSFNVDDNGNEALQASAIGALAGSLLPSLPWYVWAGLGVLAFVVVRQVVR
jgi:hypothetical protein